MKILFVQQNKIRENPTKINVEPYGYFFIDARKSLKFSIISWNRKYTGLKERSISWFLIDDKNTKYF